MKSLSPTRILVLAVVALLVVAPVFAPAFYVTLLNYIGLYSLVALGLVLLTGVAGQISFGQAAFVGLGAYTTAVLTTQYGWSPWLTLIVALVITLVIGYLLGLITLSMGGHYLPLATIAWGMSLFRVFAGTRKPLLLFHLDRRARGVVGLRQFAGLAPRSGHPCVKAGQHDG